MESEDNIILLHKKCGEKLKKDFQKKFDKYLLEVGGHVKKEFKQGKESEHMWVNITALTPDKIIGRLNNIPFIITNVKLNDLVEVKLDEIEDYVMEKEQ